MKMSIPAMPQAAGTNVDGKTKAVFPGYPANMHVGRELHGGSFEMKSEKGDGNGTQQCFGAVKTAFAKDGKPMGGALITGLKK